MKTILVLMLFTASLAGCAKRQYEVREVHDANGNKAFVRINLSTGSICTLGRGYVVRIDFTRLNDPTADPTTPYLPFCNEGETK